MKKFMMMACVSVVLLLTGCSDSPSENQPQEVSQKKEISKLLKEENYSKALTLLAKESEKTDKNVYLKRGVCYFYLDNYHLSKVNFRKDYELNGSKNDDVIDVLFDQMDTVFSEEDSYLAEDMMRQIIKDEREQDTAIIKLYTSDNSKKRDQWFGYFKTAKEEIYVIYEPDREKMTKVTEDVFAKKFEARYFATYQETVPLFSINDPTTYASYFQDDCDHELDLED